MEHGVIIVGYQGIGKSSLAKYDRLFIDLESSSFFLGDTRPDYWYMIYVNIAIHLASQGRVVFVSSHKEVRDYLLKVSSTTPEIHILCCTPSVYIKKEWIDRLWLRYEQSKSNKDWKAWQNALLSYEANIQEIQNSGIPYIEITSMNYSLKALIHQYFNDRNIPILVI